MTAAVRGHIDAYGPITLAQARDLLGTSRRHAQAFLEHLDRLRVTRRVGEARVLRQGPPAASGSPQRSG
jgi:selenocysteine-specific elongation factor